MSGVVEQTWRLGRRLLACAVLSLVVCCAAPATPIIDAAAGVDAGVDAGGVAVDGGVSSADSAVSDSGAADAGEPDSSYDSDGSVLDAVTNTSAADAALVDTHGDDAPLTDTAASDTSLADTSLADTSLADTSLADTNKPDSSAPKPLPYPIRTAYQLKAIQPDFWPARKDLIGNKVGGIAINVVWAHWQPAAKQAPCNPASEVAYDGWCFKINKTVEAEIAAYSKAGVYVTGIFWGVPPWARIPDKDCSPAGGNAAFKIFCKPKNPAQFGRFAGFIAHRYAGHLGVGRVIDFVIHNEVNSNTWFDIGCGGGKACDTKQWLDDYAANYNAAYDRIVAHQPQARVLISLEHHWSPAKYDTPAANNPLLSGQTFLKGFAKRVGTRKWRVAYHPYPPNLLKAPFGALDHDLYGKVTYGNIGVLVGWLHQTFPNETHTHEVQLTESGVNGLAPHTTQAQQAAGVCDSLRTALGTPGITNYIYHRMRDHPVETKDGLGVGLFDVNDKPKQAWATWALANRHDLKPPKLSCGFEHLPNVRLKRGYHTTKGHWATTRLLPPGFKLEKTWTLQRAKFPGSKLLFACQVGGHNLLSPSPACEGLVALGPVGYVAAKSATGLVALRRCRVGAGTDHFVSTHPTCEGQVIESVLGWVKGS